MSFTTVYETHKLGIDIQVQRDAAQSDPQSAFQVALKLPAGLASQTLPVNNNAEVRFSLPWGLIRVEVVAKIVDFALLPAGSTHENAATLAFKIVFDAQEIFTIDLGDVPVTVTLR